MTALEIILLSLGVLVGSLFVVFVICASKLNSYEESLLKKYKKERNN